MNNAAVTGWSLCLPGIRPADALASYFGTRPGQWAEAESPPPERAAERLGRKGLLSKEPATRLALCAVHKALALPPGHRPGGPPDPRTAVVACSNLNNVETVARTAATAATEGGRAISILDAPNASSNIVATTVALWFRFGGPNLMVCSGAHASADALRLGLLLLSANRADRVVLVGTEPADEVASALYATSHPARSLAHGDLDRSLAPGGLAHTLAPGAACLILTRGETPAPVALVEAHGGGRVTVGPGGFDPAAWWGGHYGAEGVIALALAAHLVADEGHARVDVDGGVRLRPGRRP